MFVCLSICLSFVIFGLLRAMGLVARNKRFYSILFHEKTKRYVTTSTSTENHKNWQNDECDDFAASVWFDSQLMNVASQRCLRSNHSDISGNAPLLAFYHAWKQPFSFFQWKPKCSSEVFEPKWALVQTISYEGPNWYSGGHVYVWHRSRAKPEFRGQFPRTPVATCLFQLTRCTGENGHSGRLDEEYWKSLFANQWQVIEY